MKKIIICFLVLISIFGCIQAYAYDESLLYGTWAHFSRTEDGEAFIECFTLTEDHKVFWFYQWFTENNDGFTRNYMGTWTFSNGTAYLVTGNTARIEGFITTNYQFAEKVSGGYILFDKLGQATKKEETPAPTPEPPEGQKVPQGEYIIGEYVQPGLYRITLVGDDLAVIWRYKAGHSMGDYYSLVYSKGETEAILRLDEGDTFKVEHASVILSDLQGDLQ